jgi:hypothetical protein
VETIGRLLIAAILAAAALSKLRTPRAGADAMAAFGFRTALARWAALAFSVASELGLAIAVVLGSDRAIYLAAALMALYALSMIGALLRGQAGRPCGCFGAESRVSWSAIARNAALAAGFAAVPLLLG